MDVVGDGLDPVRKELGIVDQCTVWVPPNRPPIVQVDVLVCQARRFRSQGSETGLGAKDRTIPHSPRRVGRKKPWRPRSLGAPLRPAARCRVSRSRRSGSTSSCDAQRKRQRADLIGPTPALIVTHQPMAGPETPRPLSSADASSNPTTNSDSTSARIVMTSSGWTRHACRAMADVTRGAPGTRPRRARRPSVSAASRVALCTLEHVTDARRRGHVKKYRG